MFGLCAQDAHACRVERADPHLVGDGSDESSHALSHLPCSLVGEGDRQDVHRVYARIDEVGDALGEHAGLARTSTGNDEERPARMEDGVALVWIEQ